MCPQTQMPNQKEKDKDGIASVEIQIWIDGAEDPCRCLYSSRIVMIVLQCVDALVAFVFGPVVHGLCREGVQSRVDWHECAPSSLGSSWWAVVVASLGHFGAAWRCHHTRRTTSPTRSAACCHVFGCLSPPFDHEPCNRSSDDKKRSYHRNRNTGCSSSTQSVTR